MTEEVPQQPKAEYDADAEFVAEDPADVVELLERAANYHAAAHHETIAAELRRGAAVLESEVASDE